MSNSYSVNQPWAPDPLAYGHHQLELEHEFDFSPSHTDNHLPQPQQQQQAFSESYQHSLPHFSSDNFAASNATFSSNQGQHNNGVPFRSNNHNSSFPIHGIYGSSQNHQNQTAFNTTPSLNQTISEPQRLYHNNDTTYDHQTTPSPVPITATSLSAVDSATTFISTSPDPILESFTRQQSQSRSFQQHPGYQLPHLQPSFSTSETHSSKVKRRRAPDEKEEEDDQEIVTDSKESVKAKAGGACARCKNLKVKCEFKTDTDPCKRCLNGGHDCVTPGRKKRRTPPKREHLLNQIREQATEIQNLMSQLEATNARHHRSSETGPRTHTPDDLHSPVLSPSSASTSYFGSDTASQNLNPNINPETNKAVEDWIAKARESLAEFGGFIGIGGMPKSYLEDKDPEDSEGSWEGIDDIDEDKKHDGEYEFAIVEDSDGEDAVHEGRSGRTTTGLRQQSSMSSLNTSATGTTSGRLPRKKNSGGSAKLATVPSEAAPFGLMADLSLKKHRRRGSSASPEGTEENGLGVASVDFFRSSPVPDPMRAPAAILRQHAPHILTREVITPQEAEKLFAIYFKRMNLSVSLLDPELYTAQRTCYRSSFLFTVICAIASRYYTERPGLYAEAMHYAQLAAGTSLIGGQKNVEMCQGYILLSLYPVPARRWDEDRSWLYLGLAIRIAMDLNLHHPSTAKPLSENHAREMLNRTRVWLNCFNLDRSTGSQYGKSPIIPNSDYIANNSENWWQSSPYNIKHFDIHICAYNAELRVMAAFMGKIYSDPHHRTGLNKQVDFEQTATETDDELQRLGDKWFTALDQTDMSDPQNCFRTGLLRLAYGYARLVALSYGLQYAFGKKNADENTFVLRCVAAATDVVNTVVDNIGRPSQRVYLRHGPEAQSVFAAFACAFLVKLLQPKFSAYLTTQQRLDIRGLVKKVVDLLGSPEVAIDSRHGPKLYARFLEGLLATPLARVNSQSPDDIDHIKTPPRQRTQGPKSTLTQTADPAFEPPSTVSDHTSPATNYTLSPPPQGTVFDPYTSLGSGLNDFISVSTPPDSIHDGVGVTISTPDFFRTPLPFENEMLQSMQSLTGSSWDDISLPGFNWMSQFQNDDSHMKSNDSMMYDSNPSYMTGPY